MTSKIEVNQIIEGKVTGIQPYGAFVALNDEVQGLVHISEVTHGYVKDINEHLTVGDNVNVKVLNVDEENKKVSLSIRATEEAPKQQKKTVKKQAASVSQDDGSVGFNSLKDKLEEWLEQSKVR
ncbi:MAG TPA: S1 domain-containing post-transcriptional regulator GSP13 [Candidatus Dormibacteraeota bacterium]|nr:S1 domain-containing post-transcriptional regulator GSP13 [Candidatus Dormibacteraeota bacterium]